MVSASKLASLLARFYSLRRLLLLATSQELPSLEAPTGFIPVYVGEERQRFLVPTASLSHPLFQMLLEKSHKEYGFDQSSGLMLPCNASSFQEVVRVVECFHGQFDLRKLVEELI